MASAAARNGPQPASTSTSPITPSLQSPAAIKQSQFDLGIAYSLGLWPALTTAVLQGWGGPDSAGKRDWFAGAVSDLFISRPDTDQEDLECVLLQVMEDEFDARLEDESEIQVAEEICQLRKDIEKGDFAGVEELRERWTRRQGKSIKMIQGQEPEEDDDMDYDEDEEEEDEDEDGGVDIDEEMIDAQPPRLIPVKQALEPEVDDDGFTKVTSKKRR